MREKLEVDAVRDRDLRAVLSHHGLDKSVDSGELPCASCACAITWENIAALKPVRGGLQVYCDDADCLTAAQEEVHGDVD